MDYNSAALGGLAVRWLHLTASVLLVGALSALLLAGRSARPTARAWELRVVAAARLLLAAVVGSGLVALAWQTALVEGRPEAAFDLSALRRFLLETQGGHVWLGRHSLLVVLAGFTLLRARLDTRIDWLAARGETALLALAALALLAASGHAAAVEPGTLLAVTVDAGHLLAAGVWVGALPPLALLLHAASREAGADARPHAVLVARRFSRLALGAVAVLALTGLANARSQVGNVAGLVGTPYGRLLAVKLALLVTILALALVNRRRLLPRLSGEAATVGRPAMLRLATLMAIEAALAVLVLGIVAAMGLTPPARHLQPSWPFSFRLALSALDGAGDRARALLGSQLVVLAIAAAVAWWVARSRRRWLLAGAGGLAAVGLGLALPPLTIDASPTTYHRPLTPYHATSITQGVALYREHCAGCHGHAGAGADGPDLRSARVARRTAGDLYWWITRGAGSRRMPGFGDRLGEETRWDLVNFVRALGAAHAARGLGPTVEPDHAWLTAPDFGFTVGPMPPRALRDYRGRRLVLLTLYSLPASLPRLEQLARNYDVLVILGVEVLAVPRAGGADAIRRLGGVPRVLFPVVTAGAEDIVRTYDLFGRAPHAEYLIDRQGYLRARWAAAGDTHRDLNLLLAEVQQLNEEKTAGPPADEHVH